MPETPDKAPERLTADPEASARAIDRRTVAKAMWLVPAAIAVTAAPATDASGDLVVDLQSTARLPVDRDGVYNAGGSGSINYYKGPRDATFTYTFRNNGPDTMPSGTLLSFGLPFATIWDSFTINDSNGYPLTSAGTRPETVSTDPNMVRKWWDFTLGSELSMGAAFNVVFTARMNSTTNTATNFYFVRPFSNIIATTSGVTDSNPDNNQEHSNAYAWFNNTNAC